MDWIDLAQSRDKWQAVVNMVMKFCIYQMWCISWVCDGPLASQGHFFMNYISWTIISFHSTAGTDILKAVAVNIVLKSIYLLPSI
jgi:hypothetical protein